MKTPVSWIREYVDLPADVTTEDLAHRLTALGLKLEAIHRPGHDIQGPLVVGRVLTVQPEPQKNGKTINWCTVDVGDANGTGEPQGIVCGAHNFAPDDLVVVVLPGGVLPGGFEISARDLDLRGAGELLGEEQAGHLQLVGLALYRHVLQRALDVAQGRSAVDEWMPEVALGVAGRIPADYVPDEETRINLYAEIDRTRDRAALEALGVDVEDRFGKPPAAARRLLKLADARVRCAELGIQKLAAGPKGIAATFRTKADAEAARKKPLPDGWKWNELKLVFPVVTKTVSERFRAATRLFDAVDPAEE